MDNSVQQNLVKYLPYLRRYARALAGDQQRADVMVLATVQSIARVNDDQLEISSREDLYRHFTHIWNGPAGDQLRLLSAGSPHLSSVDQRISAVPSQERQAFLLSAVEEFSDSQIANILDIYPADLAAVKEKARIAITNQVATDVLIIEDELLIAAHLEEIMTSLGHTIVAIERTHATAVRAIRNRKPGLVLADIQLADGSSGIDAVNEILNEGEVPVVFITAFPERLLTGLRPEPTFVLTKPFNSETVQAVVSQALFFETKARSARQSMTGPSGA